MMKSLLSTYLLLALLSSVTSLKCDFCYSRATSCESKSEVTCMSNETCASVVLRNNIDPKRKMTTFRGCVLSELCRTGYISISSANGRFLQAKVFCCHIEQCNKDPVHIPTREDLSPNGRQCPACFLENVYGKAAICQSQEMVSCLGNETKCIDFSGYLPYILHNQKLKFTGCANEDICARYGKLVSYYHLPLFKFFCYNAEEFSKQIDLEG